MANEASSDNQDIAEQCQCGICLPQTMTCTCELCRLIRSESWVVIAMAPITSEDADKEVGE